MRLCGRVASAERVHIRLASEPSADFWRQNWRKLIGLIFGSSILLQNWLSRLKNANDARNVITIDSNSTTNSPTGCNNCVVYWLRRRLETKEFDLISLRSDFGAKSVRQLTNVASPAKGNIDATVWRQNRAITPGHSTRTQSELGLRRA